MREAFGTLSVLVFPTVASFIFPPLSSEMPLARSQKKDRKKRQNRPPARHRGSHIHSSSAADAIIWSDYLRIASAWKRRLILDAALPAPPPPEEGLL